jgi:hypothetical protein
VNARVLDAGGREKKLHNAFLGYILALLDEPVS